MRRNFTTCLAMSFIILSLGIAQAQPKLRQGHAQTPEEAKEELAQFRKTYKNLAEWKLRK